MTQLEVNQMPRCNCPECAEGRRKYGDKFDIMTDKIFSVFIESMKNPEEKLPGVTVTGHAPDSLKEVIRNVLLSRIGSKDQPKEEVSLAEKYRQASRRQAFEDTDPDEDVWGEEETVEFFSADDEIEPEWLKQDTSAQLQEQFDQAEAEDISSLLTLVEAMRQQLYAAKCMNDATLSILEVLSSEL
jgi:hypothetical protein